MQYEKYGNVLASADSLEFWFESIGPKGTIKKLVQFTPTQHEDVYNLAFGNITKDGSFDDETTSNNMDRNKIPENVEM